MKLVLSREGEFTPVNMKENPTDRCGQLGMKSYKYKVEIEATDDSLSAEGFVIENGRLHNYFLTRYCTGKPWNAISCERMAIKGAMEIGQHLIKENISVTNVTVTLAGSNNAQIKASWTREARDAVKEEKKDVPKPKAGTRKPR